MHMVQHVLLIVAAPFLLLGSPLLPVLWALPRGLRRPVSLLFSPGSPLYGAFHVLTTPIVAALVYMAALGLWHVPSFYDAAQGRHLIHDLEHLTFLWASLLYWWPVVHPSGGRRRLGYGYAVFYLLVPMLEKHVIGMVLTFASQPLYDTYQQVPRVWGVSLLLDQQLAGATMWASGGIIHLVAIFVVLGLLFRQEEREARGRARFGASSATDRGQAVPESRGNGRGSRERPR
jgi:cytochrome c oxidase assembly factor CtaG